MSLKRIRPCENVMAFTGGGGPTNGGFVFVGLKPLHERDANANQVIDRLRPKFLSVSGANTFMQAGQDLRIGGRRGAARNISTRFRATTCRISFSGARCCSSRCANYRCSPTSIPTSRTAVCRPCSPMTVRPLSRLGITPQMLDNSLYEAFGQAQVSTMFTGINQYHVVLEVAPKFWQSPVNLNDVYIRAAQGKVVPLSAIAHYEPATAPLAVNHQGQYPSVTISFNLAPGIALSDASTSILAMEQKIGMPNTIHGMFSGTLQAFQSSLATEPFLIITALMAVYIVLGILYESYIHPLTIISTLPSAGVGAVLALMIFPQRPQHHRADWRHSVDRHRQEERHPDDRLCARRRTHRRQEPSRCHFPGVHPAIPAHPDDHHGSHLWRHAVGVRQGDGFGTPQPSRHRHYRRADSAARCLRFTPRRWFTFPWTA